MTKRHECYKLTECRVGEVYIMCQSNWTGKCPNGCETIRKEGLRKEILEHLFFMGFGVNTPFRITSNEDNGVEIESLDEQNKVKITHVEANKLYAEPEKTISTDISYW